MKKTIMLIIILIPLLFGMSAHAEDCIKISQNGITKQAKDIGTGKGISFTLPGLEDDSFYIYAIELAVFEKQENEGEWHIYKNDYGEESKKIYIENPESLNIQADFGDFTDYRERAKYKIAYRLYIRSVYDLSNIFILGKDIKDGWRLAGEENNCMPSDNGFTFYKNSAPFAELEGIEYSIHSPEGTSIMSVSGENISSVPLPADAFLNGVKFNLYADDFDGEDILNVSYVLKNAGTGDTIIESALGEGGIVYSNTDASKLQIKFTVTDNFGASSSTEWYDINIDREPARVISEFDDKGYAVKGTTLFCDFYVEDNAGERMTSGRAYVSIDKDGVFFGKKIMVHYGNGKYRLNFSMSSGGKYKVTLYMFDRAGNESSHVFYQTLDDTKPTYKLLTSADDTDATDYKTWLNESKKVMVEASDKLSGVNRIKVYKGSKTEATYINADNKEIYKISHPVTVAETGKIRYRGYIYDNAKVLDMDKNTVKESSDGNYITFSDYVWLDKTPPVITVSHNEDNWFDKSYSVGAEFGDNPSSSGVEDASGVKTKQYALTRTDIAPDVWLSYTKPVKCQGGGVYYLHLKATDCAGNETLVTKKIKINEKLEATSDVAPTDSYMHTIYQSKDKFYVVKNTAYNTNYHFTVAELDADDLIRCDVKLVNEDDNSVCSISSAEVQPDGEISRDVVFNMSYLDPENKKLPDGLYSMYITLTEIKNDGEEIITYEDIKACEVVIKRNAPPTPEICVSDGKVSIEYPEEPLAPSLNTDKIKALYKREYKAVKNGQSLTNVYKAYEGEFDADDFTVTALYTDIAGNVSTSTKRIFKESSQGGGNDIDASKDGNNATVEESRAANVYYVGIRREKQKGINSDIFKFIN